MTESDAQVAEVRDLSTAVRFSRAWTWSAVVAIGVITVLHYSTHSGLTGVDSHTLFRRFYYLPIATLAVVHGLRGGGLAGIAVVALYSPHAFMGRAVSVLGVHLHADPAPMLEKLSEVVLYLALGLLVGYAVDRARAAQRNLDRARNELERSARLSALGRLVAGVAHEVRNPLASLHATAEMFLDDYDEGHRKRRMVELNFEEVKRLEGVVERFLSFARPGPPVRAREEVAELLERVKALSTSTAKERGIAIDVQSPADEHVVVDGDQILQVLLNLVLNAVDASPDKATVVVRGRCEGDTCVVEVEDRGPGVPRELQERIFDPFFTTRASGTGLGLSLANQIAEAHGGSIVYESREGGGARFCLRLPCEPDSTSELADDARQGG